jgi:hypothetical protein
MVILRPNVGKTGLPTLQTRLINYNKFLGIFAPLNGVGGESGLIRGWAASRRHFAMFTLFRPSCFA